MKEVPGPRALRTSCACCPHSRSTSDHPEAISTKHALPPKLESMATYFRQEWCSMVERITPLLLQLQPAPGPSARLSSTPTPASSCSPVLAGSAAQATPASGRLSEVRAPCKCVRMVRRHEDADRPTPTLGLRSCRAATHLRRCTALRWDLSRSHLARNELACCASGLPTQTATASTLTSVALSFIKINSAAALLASSIMHQSATLIQRHLK